MKNHSSHFVVAAIFAVLCCFATNIRADEKMLANGGMEKAPADGLPPGWQAISAGKPAVVTVDYKDKKSGKSSVRLVVDDFTRSYVRSGETPVVPGEEI